MVDFLDSYDRIGFRSLVKADEEGFLDSIPKSIRHRSFHLVAPSGTVTSGANAIPGLIALLPSGRPFSTLITIVPGGRRIVAFVYSIFSRLHDTGSCSYRTRGHSGLDAGKLELRKPEDNKNGRRDPLSVDLYVSAT
jgi:predicted DCC family thiol-disulfide oxidoreductase YuxK